MAQSYVLWALLGMAGYSFMTLFVKLAERSSEVSTYMVMAVSATIVSIVAIAIVALRGEL
jgi:bacterial/archaeal transporter family protein